MCVIFTKASAGCGRKCISQQYPAAQGVGKSVLLLTVTTVHGLFQSNKNVYNLPQRQDYICRHVHDGKIPTPGISPCIAAFNSRFDVSVTRKENNIPFCLNKNEAFPRYTVKLETITFNWVAS